MLLKRLRVTALAELGERKRHDAAPRCLGRKWPLMCLCLWLPQMSTFRTPRLEKARVLFKVRVTPTGSKKSGERPLAQ